MDNCVDDDDLWEFSPVDAPAPSGEVEAGLMFVTFSPRNYIRRKV